MASEYKYTLGLISDGLRAALEEGADDATVSDAIGSASDQFDVTSEFAFDLDIWDTVTRCNWSDTFKTASGTYRLVSPDECENGATRLSDLISEPRKLARGMAHLLAEESEVEFEDDDVIVLGEFISMNDIEVEVSSESAVETFGLYILQLSAALQAAADHDRWLLATVREI